MRRLYPTAVIHTKYEVDDIIRVAADHAQAHCFFVFRQLLTPIVFLVFGWYHDNTQPSTFICAVVCCTNLSTAVLRSVYDMYDCQTLVVSNSGYVNRLLPRREDACTGQACACACARVAPLPSAVCVVSFLIDKVCCALAVPLLCALFSVNRQRLTSSMDGWMDRWID